MHIKTIYGKRKVIQMDIEIKLYDCDYTKNKECAKSSCYSIGGECYKTHNKEYSVSEARESLRHIMGVEIENTQLKQAVKELNIINERLSLRLKGYEDKERSEFNSSANTRNK